MTPKGGGPREDVDRARGTRAVLRPHDQEPVEIDAGSGEGRWIPGALHVALELDDRGEPAVRGRGREQARGDGRAARPGRPLERRNRAARKPAPERRVELAEPRAHDLVLGEGEGLGRRSAMPGRDGGAKGVERRAALGRSGRLEHGSSS